MRSNVASQSVACSSDRSSKGGRRKPAAFMTRRTFLSDSGTASYCDRTSQRSKNDGGGRAGTNHLIPSTAVHEPILVPEDLEPKVRHRLHALSLRELREVLKEDLAEQRRRSKARLAHALRIPTEDLRLEKLLEHREEDALKDDGEVDVLVREDLGGEEGALEAADGDLAELAGGVEAELGVGGEEWDPRRVPRCQTPSQGQVAISPAARRRTSRCGKRRQRDELRDRSLSISQDIDDLSTSLHCGIVTAREKSVS